MMKSRQYPFRIGSTSYVIPADIITNVKYVSDCIDDIELVLFETPGESNLPSPVDIKLLSMHAEQSDITFTVHLPIDKEVKPENSITNTEYINSICKTIDMCKEFEPYAYILHLEGVHCSNSDSEIVIWQNMYRSLLDGILSKTGIHPINICIENLAYPWEWYKPIVEEFGFSYCLDIGHLWMHSPEKWVKNTEKLLPNTRVIHLHGVCAHEDHRSLLQSDLNRLEQFMSIIKKCEYNHVLTLEVFCEKDFHESLNCVRNIWEKLS